MALLIQGNEYDIDRAYVVCTYQTFLNFTAVSMNTLQLNYMMSLTNHLVCSIKLKERNFLQSFMAPEYWE